jgi:hypothetical protein
VEFPHSEFTLSLVLTSTLDQNSSDESWGIRDLYIYTDSGNPESNPSKLAYRAFTEDKFKEAKGWTHPSTSNPISTCGNQNIFGGYGAFGAGALTAATISLEPHYELTMSFTLFKIDSWDNEIFLVYADGMQVYS